MKRRTILLLFLSIVTFFLSFGYAETSDYLGITGQINIGGNAYDVYISSVTPDAMNTVRIEEFYSTIVRASVTGKSRATFEVTVENSTGKTFVYERLVQGSEAGIDGVYTGDGVSYSLDGLTFLQELAPHGKITFRVTVNVEKAINTDDLLIYFKFIEKGGTGVLPGNPEPTQTQPPQTDPPQTDPPQTDPPQTDPPQTDPPQTDPPQTDPPQTDPPQTDPPQTDPPQTDPPQTDPPQTDPPQTDPPQTDPPQTDPPQTDPPQTDPPQTDPPQTDPPQTDPPQTDPPQTDPPQTDPPQTDPPQTDPPQTDPPQTDPPQTDPPQTDPPQTDPPQTDPPQTDPPQTDPPETQPTTPTLPGGLHDDFLGLLEVLLSENDKCLNDPGGKKLIYNAVQAALRKPPHILHCHTNSISGGTMSSIAEACNEYLTENLHFFFMPVEGNPNRMYLYMYYGDNVHSGNSGQKVLTYFQVLSYSDAAGWYADGTYVGKAEVAYLSGGGNAGKEVWLVDPSTWTSGAP